MTIRSYLNRLKRNAGIVAYIGFALCLGGVLFDHRPNAGFIILPGFGLAFLAIVYMTLLIKCPNCRTRWRHLIAGGTAFAIDRRLKVCPYCQAQLDAPIP